MSLLICKRNNAHTKVIAAINVIGSELHVNNNIENISIEIIGIKKVISTLKLSSHFLLAQQLIASIKLIRSNA